MAKRDVWPTASGGYSANSSVLSVQRVTLSTSGSSASAVGGVERLHPETSNVTTRTEYSCFKATRHLPLRVPRRSVPGARRAASRCCESVLVRRCERRRAVRGCRPRLRDTRLRQCCISSSAVPCCSWDSAACRSVSASEAPVISLRMRSFNEQRARPRLARARHPIARLPGRRHRRAAAHTVSPKTPPRSRPDSRPRVSGRRTESAKEVVPCRAASDFRACAFGRAAQGHEAPREWTSLA